jgi:hypothetical protein
MTRSLRDEGTLINLFYTAFGVALVLTPVIPAVWVWPIFHDWLILVGIGLAGFASLLSLDRATAAASSSSIAPLLGVLLLTSLLIGALAARSMAGPMALVSLLGASAVACALLWRHRQSALRGIA